MKDTKVQWHPGFVAAMNLEFAKNRGDLVFVKEYNLNTKPLEIDLLVIKKDSDAFIDNEIGAIFRGHNIVEYKSPDDHLNIDSFYKAGAYASLYKSYGETVDSIKAEDVTVSLVRDAKPEGLFQYFKEHQYSITNPYGGIYYVRDAVLFPTQIIVSKELETDTHIWLKALSDRVGKQDMAKLLERISQLTEKGDRELADSVLDVSVQVNRQILEELKGDDDMSQALLEIVEPLIKPRLLLAEETAKKKGLQEGIQGAAEVLRDLGHEDTEIRQIIQKKYSLSEKETVEYL